jgi:hypothetical protein
MELAETQQAPFSSTASQSYAFVSAWEKRAPLNALQLSALSMLTDCGELPEPEHLAHDTQASQTISDTPRAADTDEASEPLAGLLAS